LLYLNMKKGLIEKHHLQHLPGQSPSEKLLF